MADDDPGMIHVRRRTVVRVAMGVAILVAVGIGFAIGYAVHSPTSTPTRSATTATTTTTTTRVHNTIIPSRAFTTTTTAVPTTTTAAVPTPTTVNGPSLATCTAAVTGYYFPGQNPAVQLGGLSTVQAIGYGCENQAILSQAMDTAGHGTVYNGDVLTMAQDVCNDFPNSPLCANG